MVATGETADMGRTSIQVSDELADELHGRKDRGDSYEDVIWRLMDGEDADEPRESGETEEAPPTAETGEPLASGERERLRDALAGSGDLLGRRVDAILSMYDVLRKQGSAEKDELLDAVDVDATGYASPASVWANMVKGKDTLSALPGVEPPATGRSEWRYNE